MVTDDMLSLPAVGDAGGQESRSPEPEDFGLRLQSVVKRYGSATVVDAVSVDIRRGEFLTVLGPSGSGKTTILKMIAGFTDVTSGAIMLGGRDVSRMAPAERGIGMVFQNYALFPHLTVSGNVEYGLKMRGWARQARRRRAAEMLELVGLAGKAAFLPRQLSGGQQQRVALARAIAFGPQLLLMDEPLGALDRELRVRMAGELRRLHAELGTTVVYVTHDREEALTLSDRIAIMRDGRVEALGPPDELFSQPASSFTATFFGGHNVLPCRIVGVADSDGCCTVDLFGQQTAVPLRGDVPVGHEGAFVVPALALALPTGGSDVDEQLLELRVEDVLYMGDFTQVRGEVLASREPGVSVNAHLSGSHSIDLPRGEIVQFRLDTSRCSVVPWSSRR